MTARGESGLLRSGLFLAGANTVAKGGSVPPEAEDGVLTAEDVTGLDLRGTELVVLSACEVGRSSLRWGEEAIGMTRIWLHAGTRCVIAAPVIVADDAACELLGAMHTALVAGVPPAEALADAAGSTGIVAPFQVHGAGF